MGFLAMACTFIIMFSIGLIMSSEVVLVSSKLATKRIIHTIVVCIMPK